MTRQKMSLEDAITKGLTNRRAKTTTTKHRLADIAKAFKAEPWKAIGVTKKTWSTWQKGTHKPSKSSLAKIANAYATPDVRKAQLGRRGKQLASSGFTFKAHGKMGPSADEDYWRVREVTAELDSATAANILDAYILGGPESAADELKHALSEHYYGITGPFGHEDTCGLADIDRVQFRPGKARGWLSD